MKKTLFVCFVVLVLLALTGCQTSQSYAEKNKISRLDNWRNMAGLGAFPEDGYLYAVGEGRQVSLSNAKAAAALDAESLISRYLGSEVERVIKRKATETNTEIGEMIDGSSENLLTDIVAGKTSASLYHVEIYDSEVTESADKKSYYVKALYGISLKDFNDIAKDLIKSMNFTSEAAKQEILSEDIVAE